MNNNLDLMFSEGLDCLSGINGYVDASRAKEIFAFLFSKGYTLPKKIKVAGYKGLRPFNLTSEDLMFIIDSFCSFSKETTYVDFDGDDIMSCFKAAIRGDGKACMAMSTFVEEQGSRDFMAKHPDLSHYERVVIDPILNGFYLTKAVELGYKQATVKLGIDYLLGDFKPIKTKKIIETIHMYSEYEKNYLAKSSELTELQQRGLALIYSVLEKGNDIVC